MRGLILACRAAKRQEHKRAYGYTVERLMLLALCGKDMQFPTYSEYCKKLRDSSKIDDRSGDDIRNDILKRLEG